MILLRSSKRNIFLFLAGFLLCGILHVALYGVDFTISITEILCGSLTALWSITVQRRVTDRRECKLLLGIAALIISHFVFQIIRYGFIGEETPRNRWILWYIIYLPMIVQPLLCLLLTVRIYRPEKKLLKWPYILLAVVGALIAAGVLTNDLHFQAFYFPNDDFANDGKRGWLIYIAYVYVFGVYAAALIILFWKNHHYVSGKKRWIPVVPFLIGLVYAVIYPLDIARHFFPCQIWNWGEMLGFCIIGALEACIQTGMIPSNLGYDKLFGKTAFPAVILDRNGTPVFKTAAADYPFTENEDTRIFSHPISGGSVVWTMDMTRVRELNEQLTDINERIDARNAYLMEEAHIREERARVETRNRLYERIAIAVRPQLEAIEELLKDPENCDDRQLARAAVLNAYIKRRGNMELLGENGHLPAEELATSLRESLDYMHLYGVNTALTSTGTGRYCTAMVLAAYETFETIIEGCLDTLTDLIVSVRAADSRVVVRMMLKAESFAVANESELSENIGFARRIAVAKEQGDSIFVLTFEEEGASV